MLGVRGILEGHMGDSKKPATTLVPSDYVHLHNHTHYSLLDGLQKVPPMLDRIVELGMEAVAMTDHGTLSGSIELYKGCRERGIKPIIGIETYVASRKHTNKDPAKDKGRFHLVLLAMNNQGYKNLMRLSTIAIIDGFYHKPRIDHELLEQYNEGLIVLSGCIGGEVGEALRNGDYDKAKDIANWYKSIFGDRYYLELQDHGHQWAEQGRVNELLLKLSRELNIPPVVTCDAHYLRHEDQEAHEILLCVQTGTFLSDEKRMSLTETDLFVADPVDIIKRWQDICPEVVSNTRAIADRCDVTIELGKILIPKFPVPEGKTEKSFLHLLVYRGLAWRYGGLSTEAADALSIAEAKEALPRHILERAEYELGIIDNMGFNGYFLIIWDFISWGKGEGIVFGPGRGSAAGSIVAYSLRITELDPIAYDLLFERFLNPDRISMPDVDIDIQDSRRDEVIQYCVRKYGANRVANIVTFGKMAARNAVRDVARVLEVPYAEADRLSKMIPPPIQGRHIPLEKSLKDNQELKAEYESNPTSRRVFDMAVRLEGTIRSHGIHAAGVVIAPSDIVDYAPLEVAQKGSIATQYSMSPVEELGLLKMDFLGLSNLTIINNALRIIRKVYKVEIDIAQIPMDDPDTFALLQHGDTTGVFQLESAGMKRYLKELKPTEFSDIIAMCALYRPGPLGAGLTDQFVKRKNGVEPVHFLHETMRPALQSTYGVLVYQEQVMQISKDVCGFTGGEADTLRKAIGKKNREVMEKMQIKFIEGGITHSGVPREIMEKFWHDLMGFADYAFNKSHSACYGLIAFQTAYLKAHYPAAFMAALMTSDRDDTDRLAIEITECQHMGIAVLPPSVNESFHEFAVVPAREGDGWSIRFGLDAVKNVGVGAAEEIIRSRGEDGPFSSLNDFVKRVPARIVNRKNWESLIKAGAFDEYGERGALLHSLDTIIAIAQKMQKELRSGQVDLFGNSTEAVATEAQIILLDPPVAIKPTERLTWERELLGLYLSSHPLDSYGTYLAENAVAMNELTPSHDGFTATVGGTIADIREITTKNGQAMAFVKLEDKQSEMELIIFPSNYTKGDPLWQRDNVLLATGTLSAKDRSGALGDEVKMLVNSAQSITLEMAAAYQPTGAKAELTKTAVRRKKAEDHGATQTGVGKPQKLYIRLIDSSKHDVLLTLKQIIDAHPGSTETLLVLGADDARQVIRLPKGVSGEESLLHKLAQVVGTANVMKS
jgi:DNA polymerase-3 subunit alpha